MIQSPKPKAGGIMIAVMEHAKNLNIKAKKEMEIDSLQDKIAKHPASQVK